MFKWFLKKINNRKGFTLVELVVVIAILGILSAIAVPKFSASRENAAKTAHNANVRPLESAANMYIAENGVPSANMDAASTKTALDGKYVQKWPSPAKGTGDTNIDNKEYEVTIGADGSVNVTPMAVNLP